MCYLRGRNRGKTSLLTETSGHLTVLGRAATSRVVTTEQSSEQLQSKVGRISRAGGVVAAHLRLLQVSLEPPRDCLHYGYCAVQSSAVQCSAVGYSAVQCSAVQCAIK